MQKHVIGVTVHEIPQRQGFKIIDSTMTMAVYVFLMGCDDGAIVPVITHFNEEACIRVMDMDSKHKAFFRHSLLLMSQPIYPEALVCPLFMHHALRTLPPPSGKAGILYSPFVALFFIPLPLVPLAM